MVQSVKKQIFLRDADGGIVPFDAGELQTRLIGGFLATGLREDSFMSEEIVLALEYTLLNSPGHDPVFSKGEVDAAVVRLLESIGYPEVAHVFRRQGSEKLLRMGTDRETVSGLLASHLGCSAQRAENIAQIVSSSLDKLDIHAASPHLVMELARHFERDMAEKDFLAADAAILKVPQQTLTRKDIYALLPPAPKKLVDDGVLRINGITTLFPSVRFFFFMKEFARAEDLSFPVTELEIEPLLYNAGNALEEARCAIETALNQQSLPCCLSLPDIFDFLESCAGSAADKNLAGELASVLTSALDCELYRLAFD